MKLKQLSIGWRVALSAIAATSALLALALAFTAVNTSQTEARLLAEDMRTKVARVVDATAASDASLARLAITQYQLFESLFPSRSWSLKESVDAAGATRAVLLLAGESIGQRSTEVDQFAQLTQGNATVFMREGDDFVRVATSVKKEDGTRATGTRLDRAHPAYRLLIDGGRYVGRATLFGKPHMTAYVPIKQGDRLIGALYIGIGIEDELAGFVRLMQSNKILDSGQVYALDLNPGSQLGTIIGINGKQRLDPNDPAVGAFIARLRSAAAEGGVVRDRWSVIDGGLQQDEHAYYAQVEPQSKLTLVAEAHSDELNQLTRRVVVPFAVAVLVALAFVAAILVWLARRTVTRPIAQLQASLQFLADGDLSRAFTSDRQDEIGA
ncbi:MAG: Cache 3/Cache 2 fusion domain-containing protein, partial [Burkholderiaceae bacterium]|nr:Cache 3/Cache 2 fusion domain-containing protein [Burkholderiaceae bacterium]